MHAWETLSRRVILDHSRFLTVESHTIRMPDGDCLTDWPWIITPDFVTVVAINENGEFILFRQTKYAIEGESLAPAGGYIESGESPLTAAKRELLEEVGYTSDSWTHLGSYPVDGNRGVGSAHIFLALDAVPETGVGGSLESDDLEEQEMLFMPQEEVAAALRNQQFKVLPWTTAIALAMFYLR